MSINRFQLRDLIVRTLKLINLCSPEATDLLMGTAAQESWLGTFLRQVGGGPAKGAFQMEGATFNDLVHRFGAKYPLIEEFQFEQLEWDLQASIIMARIKYLSCPGAIPHGLTGQAAYWKKYYNTALGAGTIDEYLANYRKYCQ